MSDVVRAAGGVVVRAGEQGVEVLLVHRVRYDDWSFPKGKCERGEADEACAVREVEEETGLRCALADELGTTEYHDSAGRSKVVRYWLMHANGGSITPAPGETDDVRWTAIAEARELLSYKRDRALLDAVGGRDQLQPGGRTTGR